jgi:hypothetical protein
MRCDDKYYVVLSVKICSSVCKQLVHSVDTRPLHFSTRLIYNEKNCHVYPLYEMPLVHISVSVRDLSPHGEQPHLQYIRFNYLQTGGVVLQSAVWKHKHLYSFLLQWWQEFCNHSTGCLIKSNPQSYGCMYLFVYYFILRYQLLKYKKRKKYLMFLKNGGSATQTIQTEI